MKKLFLTAAIVGAALCAQAETSWQLCINDFNDYNENAYSGDVTIYAYLFGGDRSSAQTLWTVTVADGVFDSVDLFTTELLEEDTSYAFYFTAEKDEYSFTLDKDSEYESTMYEGTAFGGIGFSFSTGT